MYGRLLVIQVLSIAVVAINSFVDNLIVSACFGAAAIGASGIIGQAALVPAALSGIISMGLYNTCSKSMGAKDFELGCKELGTAFMLVSALFIPLVIFIEIYSEPVCALLCQNSDANFVTATTMYLRGLAPSLYLSAVIPYLMYTCQMNRKSHWCSISVASLLVINIGGNLLVAYRTSLGVFGIGLSTTASALIAALVLVGPAISRKSPLHLCWKIGIHEFGNISKKMISFGLPSAVTTLSNAFAGMWINNLLITVSGYTAVAAYTCAASVIRLLYTPANSLWYCTAIIASVMFGKNMHKAIEQLPKVFTKIAVVTTAIPLVIAIVFSEPLCSLFIKSQPEVLGLAITCTCILAFNLFPNALITCFQSLLRSTEHRIAAVMLPAIYLAVFLPLVSWPLAFSFGAPGVCVGRVAAYCMGIIVLAITCAILKKANPFKASTYVFLAPLKENCFEANYSLSKPDQIEGIAAQMRALFESHGNAKEGSLLPKASTELLEALLAKTLKRTYCWIHAAIKDGQPWVQITCSRKTLDADFAQSLDFGSIEISYLDFSTLGAIELYKGSAPYGSNNEGD